MKVHENELKFFRPLWRRIVVLVILVAWMAFEIFYGDTFFLVLVGAALAYFLWFFVITFPKQDSPEEGNGPPQS